MLSEIRYRTIQNTHKGIYSYIGLICKTMNKEFEICLRILSLLLIVEFFSIEMLKWIDVFVLISYFLCRKDIQWRIWWACVPRVPLMAHTHCTGTGQTAVDCYIML